MYIYGGGMYHICKFIYHKHLITCIYMVVACILHTYIINTSLYVYAYIYIYIHIYYIHINTNSVFVFGVIVIVVDFIIILIIIIITRYYYYEYKPGRNSALDEHIYMS